jgi:hypothetical protein
MVHWVTGAARVFVVLFHRREPVLVIQARFPQQLGADDRMRVNDAAFALGRSCTAGGQLALKIEDRDVHRQCCADEAVSPRFGPAKALA